MTVEYGKWKIQLPLVLALWLLGAAESSGSRGGGAVYMA